MRRGFTIGLSVLLFGVLFMTLRTGKEINGGIEIKESSYIEDIRIVQKNNGVPGWSLSASRADFVEGGDKAELKDISMFIQEKGIVLRADKGVYDFKDKSFTTDSIVRAEGENYTITADSIDYDISSGEIETEGRIKVESKTFKVEGKGLKADQGQTVEVLNDVKAIFHK